MTNGFARPVVRPPTAQQRAHWVCLALNEKAILFGLITCVRVGSHRQVDEAGMLSGGSQPVSAW